MSATQPPFLLLRRVAAVFAGLLAAVILSLGTDVALHAAGIFPALGQPMSSSLLLLATAYRTVYSVAASYIGARLAPDRPMGHALFLGLLGLLVTTAGAAATWNHQPSLGPHWYPLALIALSMPCAWLGGWLHLAQLRKSTANLVSNHPITR